MSRGINIVLGGGGGEESYKSCPWGRYKFCPGGGGGCEWYKSCPGGNYKSYTG